MTIAAVSIAAMMFLVALGALGAPSLRFGVSLCKKRKVWQASRE